MMKKIILSAACMLAPIVSMQAVNVTDTLKSLSGYTAKNDYKRVSIHDPSIFMDTVTSSTPRYYIYGSHLGRAYTSSLAKTTSWTWFKAGEESENATNSLFADPNGTLVNYADAYSTHAVKTVKDCNGNEVAFGNFDAHEWQYTGYKVQGNQWAPDVVYNKTMKKWCMYMSVNGDKWGSSIVCLTSSSPQGPWIYQGPVVFSGFQGTYDHNGFTKTKDYEHTDLQIAIGSVSSLPSRYAKGGSWGTYWPNCIDPCVFYDDDDNLWMSYGSWSGGIFMLKLNPENGLRDYEYKYSVKSATSGSTTYYTQDPYFGIRIAGGAYVSGEGSYIEKIGKYYFLFMSYGGFAPDGGYQMRIFRSESPTGPYVDAQGNSAEYASYVLNYSSTSRTNRGVLLSGGFKWELMPVAELSQGHNSAFTDKKGRSLLVCHTKFNDGTAGHQVRIRQLFLNQDGWLVSMPYEFNNETVTQEKIETTSLYSVADIVGTYQLIRHTYCQNTAANEYQTPVSITLNEDGTVTGAYTGKWEVPEGTSYINLTLAGVTYKGVLEQQTIDYTSSTKALCIAAVSSSSGTFTNTSACTKQVEIWASKADAKGAIYCTWSKSVAPNTTLNYNLTNKVTDNLNLPTTGMLGASVTWTSSDPSVITSSGQIVGSGNAVLTLAISKDSYVYLREFKVNVVDNIQTYYPSCGKTDFSTPYMGAFSETYSLAKGQSARFRFVNHTDGVQNWNNWLLLCSTDAAHSNLVFNLRADNWELVSGGNTGCVSNYDWNTFKTDMDGAVVNMTVTYGDAGKVSMVSTITTKAGKVLDYAYNSSRVLSNDMVYLTFSVEKAYIEGIADGIGDVIFNDSEFESHILKGIYDLCGHKFHTLPSTPGVYIVGGKKIQVK